MDLYVNIAGVKGKEKAHEAIEDDDNLVVIWSCLLIAPSISKGMLEVT